MSKLFFSTISALIILLSATAHINAVTVIDDQGLPVSVDQPSRRIISLAPHTTELLFAAGAGERIVGVVRYSYYPEAARKIPTVGETSKLDLELILALDPDLIVAWQSNAAADTEILRTLNFPIYVSEPKSLEAIASSIVALGRLAGTVAVADLASAAFLTRLKTLETDYSGRQVISTFYQFWHDPIFTINGEHLISNVIKLCGGDNIFDSMSILSAQISQEAVIRANPEVIVASGIDETRPPWLDQWYDWPQLTAVKNNHIYHIPPDLIQRHTPRILDGAAMMCEYIDKARSSTGGE